MAETWVNIAVGAGTMRAFLSTPEGSGPHPAVVTPPHSGGTDPWYQDITRRLTQAGYVGLCPDPYHRHQQYDTEDGPAVWGAAVQPHFSNHRSDNLIEDIAAAVAFLKTHPEVDGERIGVLGICGGGQIAYLMAAAIPDLKAACLYSASNVFRPWADGIASWDRTADIHCPILGHFGETDPNPSLDDMRTIGAELARLGKPHEFHTYPNAGHNFMANHRVELYHEPSSTASWPRTLAFFERYLGKVPTVAP